MSFKEQAAEMVAPVKKGAKAVVKAPELGHEDELDKKQEELDKKFYSMSFKETAPANKSKAVKETS